MLVQKYDWGKIEWVIDSESLNTSNVMSIGFLTLDPMKRQKRHIHFGEEQIIYIIDGEGLQIVEDNEMEIKKGDVYFVESGAAHESINKSEYPLIELIISFPTQMSRNQDSKTAMYELLDEEHVLLEGLGLDKTTVEKYEKFIKQYKFPVNIFDSFDNLKVTGVEFPKMCKELCKIDECFNNCHVYEMKDKYGAPNYRQYSAYICKYGLTVFIVPIFFRDQVVGYLKGGHFKTNEFTDEERLNPLIEKHLDYMDLVHRGRINAIIEQLKSLSNHLLNDYMTAMLTQKINKNEESLKRIVDHEVRLEKSLKESEDRILSIQLNNHFLFNTLNAVASLALKENSFNTYKSIVDLAEMFRYNLRTRDNEVRLKDEIDYLKNYIELQKLRYGDNLEVVFDIDNNILDYRIPFNCLQPIVENCFNHGFPKLTEIKKINIFVKDKDDLIEVKVENNGESIKEKFTRINYMEIYDHKPIKNNGIFMLISKLEIFFGDNFEFEIKPQKKDGTTVTLYLPKRMR